MIISKVHMQQSALLNLDVKIMIFRILFVLLGMVCYICSYSIEIQSLPRNEEKIVIYSTPISNDTLTVCYGYKDSDIGMEMYIDGSTLRDSLRNRVTLYQISGPDTITQCSGWVDKNDCIVYVLTNRYYGSDGYIDVFQTVDFSQSPIRSIKTKDDIKAKIIDYDIVNGTLRLKVKFTHSGNEYVGWIRRWCSNMYVSCT